MSPLVIAAFAVAGWALVSIPVGVMNRFTPAVQRFPPP